VWLAIPLPHRITYNVSQEAYGSTAEETPRSSELQIGFPDSEQMDMEYTTVRRIVRDLTDRNRLEQFCDMHYSVQHRASRATFTDLLQWHSRVEHEQDVQRALERQMVRGTNDGSNFFHIQEFYTAVPDGDVQLGTSAIERLQGGVSTSPTTQSSAQLSERDVEEAVETMRESAAPPVTSNLAWSQYYRNDVGQLFNDDEEM
jgi:hypothetical protein